ncbi:MAG: restriction endonuclease subunit S [Candidatus Cloacimonetes bacterium]|nr:restriction endonuclease subunit S [Candidatus Cloacimonadota bacterium]
MTDIQSLIIDHIDIWTSSIKTKSTTGRGSSKKLDLYGIKKLRELILQLAVMGKLVPQDPNDEPASVLLEKIAQEKERLIKEKKIKKQKVLAEVGEDEKSFDIPIHWEWVRLAQVCTKLTDGFHHTPKKYMDGFMYVSPKNIKNGTLDWDSCDYVCEEDYRYLQRKITPVKGDILVANRGTVGVPVIVDREEFCFQNIAIIGFNQNYVCSKYVYYYLLSKRESIINHFVNGGIQPMLSNKMLSTLDFVIPPFQEQKRIVAKVDELMALCDDLENQTENSIDAHKTLVETLLSTLTNSQSHQEFTQNWTRISDHFHTLFTTEHSIDQLKKTILQLAVMGKLVPQNPTDEPASVLLEKIALEKERLIKEKKIKKQKALPEISEDEKPFDLPVGWSFSYLQDLCSLITDGTHQTPKYTEVGRPFVSAQCVKPFKFIPSKCRFISEEHYRGYIKNRKPEQNDILLSRVGAGIGEAAIIDTDLEFAIYVSTGLLKPIKEHILPSYLVLWLNSPVGRGYSKRNTLGIGVSQGNLNLTLIRQFIVSIPPIQEQNKVVIKVDELMVLCEQLKSNLIQVKETKLILTDTIVDQVAS